jgi:hypothetical protein
MCDEGSTAVPDHQITSSDLKLLLACDKLLVACTAQGGGKAKGARQSKTRPWRVHALCLTSLLTVVDWLQELAQRKAERKARDAEEKGGEEHSTGSGGACTQGGSSGSCGTESSGFC